MDYGYCTVEEQANEICKYGGMVKKKKKTIKPEERK
jgi:hypothetical protein